MSVQLPEGLMVKKRLIANLVWRNGMIVQSINFKHTNVVGNALTAVDFFNTWAIDEIVILDVSREREYREDFHAVVRELSKRCFVPLSVGGWIDSLDEIRQLLLCGADKVVINTKAFQQPEFIKEAAQHFGNQCIIVSIDARRQENQQGNHETINHEVIIDRGRQATGVLVEDWARQAEALGAGEILITSIDNDGGRKGYDVELIRKTAAAVSIPVIAFGGVGKWEHFLDGLAAGAEAVAAANIFHYMEHSTKLAKEFLVQAGVDARRPFFFKLENPRNPTYKVVGY